MKEGVWAMIEASQGKQRSSNAQELNNPIDIEEEFRKKEFPEICSESCPHRTCAYYREENFGSPCQMRWKPKETKSLDSLIENAVKKAFKPIEDRISRLENQEKTSTVTRSFNGQEPLPVGFPELFELQQRRKQND